MTRDRLLVTGGSGLLGSSIIKVAKDDFNVYATYNTHPISISGCECIPLDVRDEDKVLSLLGQLKPQLVIHTAALAKVDYCEDHPEETHELNVIGAGIVAKASTGGTFIYVSTVSVFDGKKGIYGEDDTPSPLSVYSQTKLEGERIIQSILPDSIIVRTAFYGWSLYNHTSLAEWVFYNLRDGKQINMMTDWLFSPIFTGDLAQLMFEMYRRRLSGIYHVTGEEYCSKYDFGIEIARAFGFDTNNINPASIDDIEFKAPRPRNLTLDVSKIKRDLNMPLPGLKDGITRFRNTAPS